MSTILRKIDEREYTSEKDIGILYSEGGLRSPRGGTADLQWFQVSADNNIVIPPGMVWVSDGAGGFRVLPAVKATAATTTSQRVLTVKHPNIFKVGEVLTKDNGDALGTIQSIDLDASTITLAANSTTAVAIGDVVKKTGTNYSGVQGINISTLNLSERSNDVAFYTSASVYGDRLPMWNSTIAAALPEITLV
jgi:hypothetical protein